MTVQNQMTRAAICVASSLLLSILSACGGAPVAPPPSPPEVGVAQPVRRDVTLYTEFNGTTRAAESVEVRARIPGTLESVEFEPSRMVEEGDLLFVIEPRPYKAALDEAEAGVGSAKAELARTESDLDRVSLAIKTNAVAQADVDLARAQRDKAEAAVLSAEARLDKAELQYSYTQVRSPIAGQVGRNRVDAGNLVGGGEATILTSVKRLDPIFVYFDAPEKAVLEGLRSRNIAQGSESDGDVPDLNVGVATLADEGFPHHGTVDFISNRVDSATGTIEVRAVLGNEGLLLFPGLFVRVQIAGGTVEDAILVDERSVGTDLGGRYVYLVGEGNVVEQRYVELGPVQDDGMVYIVEGLDGSETYIVEGILRARPGLPVSPQDG